MLASLPSAPEWMRSDDLDEWRRAADLEADIDADLALNTLGDFEGFAGLRDIDADGLFAVGVLASGNDRFEVLDVEEGWGGDLDRVDVLAGGELFEGTVAVEGELGVDGGDVERCVDLIEVLFAEGELVGKDVGERGDAGSGVLRERGGDSGAAIAAAEQAKAHGGVGLIGEGGFRLHDEEAGGRGGGLKEVASVHDDFRRTFSNTR